MCQRKYFLNSAKLVPDTFSFPDCTLFAVKTHSALLASLLTLLPALAAPALRPMFDTHLHYDSNSASRYTTRQIINVLEAGGVTRAVVTGLPPGQALRLYEAAPGMIIPLLGVYLKPEDRQDWTQDPGLPARVEQQLRDGPWRGVGELHLFAGQRRSPVFLRIVELASRRGLPLLLHCDPAVIDSLYEHSPGARVVWAHAGAYPYPALLADYLDRYPHLYLDLSMRDARIAPDGELDPEWERLLWEYTDRFMVGVDTFSVARWEKYGVVATRIRHWLAQLPEAVAERIAYRNAVRVFAVPE